MSLRLLGKPKMRKEEKQHLLFSTPQYGKALHLLQYQDLQLTEFAGLVRWVCERCRLFQVSFMPSSLLWTCSYLLLHHILYIDAVAVICQPRNYLLLLLKFNHLYLLVIVAGPAKKWAVTCIGLGCIPLIIHPIDSAVDLLLESTIRKWFHIDNKLETEVVHHHRD